MFLTIQQNSDDTYLAKFIYTEINELIQVVVPKKHARVKHMTVTVNSKKLNRKLSN